MDGALSGSYKTGSENPSMKQHKDEMDNTVDLSASVLQEKESLTMQVDYLCHTVKSRLLKAQQILILKVYVVDELIVDILQDNRSWLGLIDRANACLVLRSSY